MFKTRITALIIILLGLGIGLFVYKSQVASLRLTKNEPPKGIANFPLN